jgi:hypothetical protein
MDRNYDTFAVACFHQNVVTSLDANEIPSATLQNADEFLPRNLLQMASSRI